MTEIILSGDELERHRWNTCYWYWLNNERYYDVRLKNWGLKAKGGGIPYIVFCECSSLSTKDYCEKCYGTRRAPIPHSEVLY